MADMMDDEEDEEMEEALCSPVDPEELHITFLYMGQGDCILLSCPDGKRILVDCGSSGNWPDKYATQAHLVLRGKAGVHGCMRLHALIFTHPDKDHYNQVPYMLGGQIFGEDVVLEGQTIKAGTTTDSIDVDTVYFSYRTSPLGGALVHHHENGTNDALYNSHGVKEMRQVFLRGRTDDTVLVWKGSFSASRSEPGLIVNGEVSVASGTTAKGIPWSVSIIAGNVARDSDDPSDWDGKNASSLVTLVRMGSERALLTGDATLSTERFLVASRSAQISKVYLAQAPHHGSALTSSSQPFVDAVAPKAVAVSVQFWETRHRLPDRPAITRWLAKVQQTQDTAFLDSWEVAADYKPGYDNSVHALRDTWERTGVPHRQQPPQYIRIFDEATFGDDYVVLWPADGYKLFRARITADLRTTGQHGDDSTLAYILTGP